MATTTTSNGSSQGKSTGSTRKRGATGAATAAQRTAPKRNGTGRSARYTRALRRSVNEVPTWVGALASVVGVGVAVGAGLFATRNQWMPKAREWAGDFNAAFADNAADRDNFDQTRGAGKDAMRDDPGEWDDIDDLSDASFPASDPPSFSPTTI